MIFKAANRFGHLAHSLVYDWEPTLGFCLLHHRSLTGLSPNSSMDVVKETVKRATVFHDRVALSAENNSYNYAQIVSSAWSICNHLCSGKFTNFEGCKDKTFDATTAKLGSLHGVRIGIVAKPSAEFVAGVLGTWLSGGVVVPLALSYPETELLHVMNDSEISMVLSTQEQQELMEKVASKCYSKISLLPSVTSSPSNTDLHEPAGNDQFHLILKLIEETNNSRKVEGDDPALILYTSGTTGKPKGVVHTHKGIISQVQILSEAWEYRCTDRLLNCLPLHHVHGLFNALLAPLYAGAVVEFMPKFSVRGVWQRWRESYPDNGNDAGEAITLFTAVPTIYSRLLQGYEAMDLELRAASASAARRLRLMMCGSSALPYPLMKQWEKITGQRLLERYGMTEFVMALANPLHGIRKAGTVGKPLPQVEAKIIGEDGTIINGIGELCIRSPSLFKEYWKQPKVTKESFIDGGFFKTGDTVSVDEDGYYTILGRSNADIMKVGGYKLSALEIEAVLLENPVVSECCVLGLQDKYYGEVVCAVIVPREDVVSQPAFTLEELQEWSKERLAPYKIPTKLFLWDALPRNAMGKVNKKEIQKGLEN